MNQARQLGATDYFICRKLQPQANSWPVSNKDCGKKFAFSFKFTDRSTIGQTDTETTRMARDKINPEVVVQYCDVTVGLQESN